MCAGITLKALEKFNPLMDSIGFPDMGDTWMLLPLEEVLKVGLRHEEQVVNGVELYISTAEKLIGGTRERLRKAGLRREIVKLHAEVNLGRGAGGAGGGINCQAVHVTEAYTCKFGEGARGHINRGYFAGNKWISQGGVTEHCLVRHAIISETRVGPRVKIGVGNVDNRPKLAVSQRL